MEPITDARITRLKGPSGLVFFTQFATVAPADEVSALCRRWHVEAASSQADFD